MPYCMCGPSVDVFEVCVCADRWFSGDLQNLLGAIGSDIKKKMDSKRKKVENLTQATVAATSKRSCQLFQKQQNER